MPLTYKTISMDLNWLYYFLWLLQNLEKVFKHRDLQQKLLETKLAQANAVKKDAEEKHKLEKAHVRFLILVSYCTKTFYMHQTNTPLFYGQLLKQAAEAKLQVTLIKEQETDLKAQVNSIKCYIFYLYFTSWYFNWKVIQYTFLLQLAVYSEKFDEFKGVVSQSNGVYASFKQDIDKVGIYYKDVVPRQNRKAYLII